MYKYLIGQEIFVFMVLLLKLGNDIVGCVMPRRLPEVSHD